MKQIKLFVLARVQQSQPAAASKSDRRQSTQIIHTSTGFPTIVYFSSSRRVRCSFKKSEINCIHSASKTTTGVSICQRSSFKEQYAISFYLWTPKQTGLISSKCQSLFFDSFIENHFELLFVMEEENSASAHSKLERRQKCN